MTEAWRPQLEGKHTTISGHIVLESKEDIRRRLGIVEKNERILTGPPPEGY